MTKREQILTALNSGWVTVPELLTMTGWKPHTLRSVLSREGNIERKRENGITSYRKKSEVAA